MAFAYVILSLVLLVVFHELGHFLAARAVGIRATKFYVFFPPALWKRRIGDVEYGVGAIPAGGFVRLPGMFQPQPGEVAERLRWEYEHVLPFITDPALRLQLDAERRAVAHAADADELLAPLTQIRATLDDAARGEERPEALAALRRAASRVESLHDDAHPRAYWRAALWRRMTVIFAGPLVNLVIAFVVLTGFHWMLTPVVKIDQPVAITSVIADSPAERAGMTDRVRVTAWNGDIVGLTPEQLADRIRSTRGETVAVSWLDDAGDEHHATLTPRLLDAADERPLVGLTGWELHVRHEGRRTTDPLTASRTALEQMRVISVENLRRLPQVFYDEQVRGDVSSVVGIVQVADDVDRAGQIVGYVAIISLLLAVMNLLPLLPLDGGHLLFGLLEFLRRGRPMPRSAFERYSMVGLALVLVLFVIGLGNDLGGT